jgi:hypothetical protein
MSTGRKAIDLGAAAPVRFSELALEQDQRATRLGRDVNLRRARLAEECPRNEPFDLKSPHIAGRYTDALRPGIQHPIPRLQIGDSPEDTYGQGLR